MKAKKYFLVYVVLLMFSPSLAKVNVPVKAQEPYVKVYIDQPLGYIPGQLPGQEVTVDIIVEVSGIADNSPQGIIGWGMNVYVYPEVLEFGRVRGATNDYFLWEFADYYWYGYPSLLSGMNRTPGYLEDLAEMIIPAPPGGAGDG